MVLLPGLHAGLGIPGAYRVPGKLRRMSTPGRSDTWCAPFGTRSSRSSRPCNSRQAVRVDLGHEDWEDKVECPASPKALFKEVPDTPPSNASWDVIPANKPAITKMAADEVPPPRGPLTVVATTARKGPTKAYSMHLLDTDGVTVGCGWRPGPLKISELAEQDFHAEPEVYLGCTRCFRHFTFPSTWMAVDSEASISFSSDTDEAWTLSRTRRRSSSRKLSEGWIAQVPRALTRFPPCLKARRQGERAQVPTAPLRGPAAASGERRCRRP